MNKIFFKNGKKSQSTYCQLWPETKISRNQMNSMRWKRKIQLLTRSWRPLRWRYTSWRILREFLSTWRWRWRRREQAHLNWPSAYDRGKWNWTLWVTGKPPCGKPRKRKYPQRWLPVGLGLSLFREVCLKVDEHQWATVSVSVSLECWII